MSKKQFLSLIFALCLVFVLAACGESEAAPSSEPAKATEGTEPTGDATEPTSPDKTDDPTDPEDGAQSPADTDTEPSQTVTRITLSANQAELDVGATYQLNVTFEPAAATPTISFDSDDPDVATVDSTGLITAVGSGTCTITVTCNGLTAECTVTCNDTANQDPELEPEPEPEPNPNVPSLPEDEEIVD